MPNSYDVFPSFFKTRSGDLYAVLDKNRMFHLKFAGNRGDGFEFRIYKTRRTVLKHQGEGSPIGFAEFKMSLTSVFGNYMLEITNLLPVALREPDARPALAAPPSLDSIEAERAVDYIDQQVSSGDGLVDGRVSRGSTHGVFMGRNGDIVYDSEEHMCEEVALRMRNKYPGVAFNVKSLV